MQTTLVTEQMNGNTAIKNKYNIWARWTNEEKNVHSVCNGGRWSAKACEYENIYMSKKAK